MDYQRHYNNLLEKALNRNIDLYYEVHHIIPKCVGGNDNKENLVKLTPEEHYVAHQLLIRIYPNNEKLIYAAMMMCANRKGNKVYGWLRKRLSETQKFHQLGEKNSQYGTMWITNGISAKKINKSDSIPENWVKGRVIKPIKDTKIKLYGIHSEKYNWIKEQETEIINEFKTHKSISKILKDRGFVGREGNAILSKWLKSKGYEPLKRRNTKE